MENELRHHGVLGMKWGQHKARVNNMKKSMYSKNAKISSDFKKSKGKPDSTVKTVTYAANKLGQFAIRRKDRAKMMSDFDNKNKNRGVSVVKAVLKTGVKDWAVNTIPAATVTAGTLAVTGNPILAVKMGNIANITSRGGIMATRINNMYRNK